MKAKAKRKNIHLCYIDISRAYDSVNRSVLWNKLKSIGFGASFLGCIQSLYTGDSVDTVVNGRSSKEVYLGRGVRQGCSLSPLLFVLYIAEIGMDIAAAKVGFKLGGILFNGLLFADDIVLIATTFNDLESLIAMVKKHCDDLQLTISSSKSKIVTPDEVDHLLLLDAENNVTLTLSKVLSYKYLGSETTLLMSSTGSKHQQKCIHLSLLYIHIACMIQ